MQGGNDVTRGIGSVVGGKLDCSPRRFRGGDSVTESVGDGQHSPPAVLVDNDPPIVAAFGFAALGRAHDA